MRKLLLLAIYSFLSVCIVSGQTTATNFNALDCKSLNHNLFDELDQGYVIVMVWVMPCSSCIPAATTAYNVVESFAATECNVKYYLLDDYGTTDCSVLTNWGNTNLGLNCTKFSDPSISMDDYGSPGMPKIVVVGGSDHQIYYNAVNTVNATELQNAINMGCTTGRLGRSFVEPQINFYPNPVNGKFFLELSETGKNNINVDLIDMTGKIVFNDTFSNVESVIKEYDFGFLLSGVYSLRIDTGDSVSVRKVILQ